MVSGKVDESISEKEGLVIKAMLEGGERLKGS